MKECTHHWWWQRFSAGLLLISFILFFILLSLEIKVFYKFSEPFNFVEVYQAYLFSYPIFNILLLGLILYHGTLGMQIVIEDYIHKIFIRNILISSYYTISIITFIIGVFLTLTNVYI